MTAGRGLAPTVRGVVVILALMIAGGAAAAPAGAATPGAATATVATAPVGLGLELGVSGAHLVVPGE